jgi:asparagine synthase (glutamine-hydrolysing)
MKGFAGIFYPDIFQIRYRLNPMLEIMHPLESQIHDSALHKNFQLGMAGSKLTSNEKKNIVLAFCGFLSNEDVLHDELRKNGSNNQAQMILMAYEKWGPDCFAKLNGDFAIALYDKTKERLFLVRDRMGKKPVYWYQGRNYFIFATELKALLISGLISQTPSHDGLASYLYFGYIPQDMSPIKQVNKLLPGYYLQLNRDGSIFIPSYWSYSSFFGKKNGHSLEDDPKHLEELIEKSIKVRVPKQGSIGCYLSESVGSACLAADLHKKASDRLYPFSIGEKNSTVFELAKMLHLPHPHEVEIVRPNDLLNQLVPIVWSLGEPLADPHVTILWELIGKAAEKTTTLFSEMGYSQLFDSQRLYALKKQNQWNLPKLLSGKSGFLKSFAIPLLNYIHPPAAFSLLKKLRLEPWQFEYMRQKAIFNEKEFWEASPKLAALFDPEVFLHKFHNLKKMHSPVSAFLYLDVKTRLADSCMLKMERLISAHNMEWQTPYLDSRLFEYAAEIIDDQCFEKEAKAYLEKMIKPTTAQKIFQRQKNTLFSRLADSEAFKEICHLLEQGTLADTGFISKPWLKKQISQTEKSFKILWSVLILEIWFRLFIDRPLSIKAPDVSLKDLLST